MRISEKLCLFLEVVVVVGSGAETENFRMRKVFPLNLNKLLLNVAGEKINSSKHHRACTTPMDEHKFSLLFNSID
jgi:hypothetical protein